MLAESLHSDGFEKFLNGATEYWSLMRILHFDENEARKYTESDFKWAMEYYMKALELSPEPLKIIRDIKRLILEAHWIEWSDSDLIKAGLMDEIDKIKEIAKKRHELRMEQEKMDLNQGYFGRSKRSMRRWDLGVEIRNLESKILDTDKLEKND